jgi:hypothetical protein
VHDFIVVLGAGVGENKARVLAKQYPTPRHMFEVLRHCKGEAERSGRDGKAACLAMLSNVPLTLSSKVGMVAATGIYEGLFQPGWHD